MQKIVISTSSFGEYDLLPLQKCRDAGYTVICNPYGRKVAADELVELAHDAIGLIAGTECLSEEILKQLPKLKVISRCGAGLDNVDVDSAKRLGIKVFNTPDEPTVAVAELTIGLILTLLRKIALMDKEIRNNIWKKRMGNLLFGKQVGIIGFGRIGQKVAELLSAFGVELAYYDIEPKPHNVNCIEKKLEDILSWADIITLHCSQPTDYKVLIGKGELRKMKKGAWLVNTSRSGLVDEDSLYSLLKEGYLSGAALDVFGQEPYIGRLKELDNVILTPHIGSYAKEARIQMEIKAVNNLLMDLGDKKE